MHLHYVTIWLGNAFTVLKCAINYTHILPFKFLYFIFYTICIRIIISVKIWLNFNSIIYFIDLINIYIYLSIYTYLYIYSLTWYEIFNNKFYWIYYRSKNIERNFICFYSFLFSTLYLNYSVIIEVFIFLKKIWKKGLFIVQTQFISIYLLITLYLENFNIRMEKLFFYFQLLSR